MRLIDRLVQHALQHSRKMPVLDTCQQCWCTAQVAAVHQREGPGLWKVRPDLLARHAVPPGLQQHAAAATVKPSLGSPAGMLRFLIATLSHWTSLQKCLPGTALDSCSRWPTLVISGVLACFHIDHAT